MTPSSFSHHRAQATLGAGCCVIHDENVLLVQLNYGKYRGHWILPGGALEPGEHPAAAAARETKEETGLEVTIRGQLAVRHRVFEEKPHDVYWVFMGELSFRKKEIEKLSLKWPQEEIQEARFWKISEAIQADQVRPLTRLFIQRALQNQSQAHQAQPIPKDHSLNDEVFGV